MPKSVARSKTRKAVAKRFKITARERSENAFLATPSDVVEKREAQAPAGQSSARRPDRRGENKDESSFRLRRNRYYLIRRAGFRACKSLACLTPARPRDNGCFCLVSSNESPAQRFLPLLFVFGLSSSCLWSSRRTTAGPLLTNQAQARGCKDHAD